MNPIISATEAKAWLDGFASGAIFFASSKQSFRDHSEAMAIVRRDLERAQKLSNPTE